MANSVYQLLKTLKSASSLYGGGAAIRPVEPFPNSIAAKQMEQQEIAAEAANSPENQLQQTQKAQQDAVNQLQQAQQQIQQLQGELQNAQMTSQQQAQQAQMQAQQEAQQAKMDAQYELQAEKIKNQKELLSMQEKYMKGMQKQPKDQGGILSNQLKRVVNRVSKLNKVASIQVENRAPAAVAPANNSANSAMKSSGAPMRTDAERAARRQRFDELKKNMPQGEIKGLGVTDVFGNVGKNVGEYWKDPKAFMASNNPGLNDSFLWDMTGGFTTNVNSGLSNLARGNFRRGAADLIAGYAQGAATIGLGGVGGAGAKTGAGALMNAAGKFFGAPRFLINKATGRLAGEAPKILSGSGLRTGLALGAGASVANYLGGATPESSEVNNTPQTAMPFTPMRPQDNGGISAPPASAAGSENTPNIMNVLQTTGYQMGPYFSGLPQQKMIPYRGPSAYENVKSTLFNIAPFFGVNPSLGTPDYNMFYPQGVQQ